MSYYGNSGDLWDASRGRYDEPDDDQPGECVGCGGDFPEDWSDSEHDKLYPYCSETCREKHYEEMEIEHRMELGRDQAAEEEWAA